MKKFNFIEVCAGCGGLSTGLLKNKFKALLLNDNNKNCCETLKINHQNVNIICDSMVNLKINQYKNKVDLLCGGVPCQSFSQSGKRLGLADDRGNLMLEFINMISIIKPKIFMIENVKGLVTLNNGDTLNYIIEKIKEKTNNEYNIEYKILNAFNYEVPQKRERIFIVGIKKKYNIKFNFPKESKKKIILKDILKNVPESEGAKYNETKISYFKKIPPGGCWINLSKEEQMEYLGNSYNSGGGKRGILRRLSMNEPSLTLLCSPSQKQTERCHPSENRPLNIREYARIQTFPDSYKFYGSISSKYKQIGNAVPCKLAEFLGKELRKTLKKIYLKEKIDSSKNENKPNVVNL